MGRESLHGWQSSYAMDCRSMDLGANPGPCSTSRSVVTLEFDEPRVDVAPGENNSNPVYVIESPELGSEHRRQ